MRKLHLLALSVLALATTASAATDHGEWTMSPSGIPGRIQFSINTSGEFGHHSSSSSDWSTADFHGLDFSTAAKHDVRFTIVRDAGNIECEGFLQNGEGAGLFTFKPNQQYGAQMSALGLTGFTPDEQFAFALHDVSLAFARQMKAAGIADLDADKLIAFRIHGVSEQFVKDFDRLGYSHLDADKLIAFRIHGVSPAFVRQLEQLGYARPDADELVALRIHGVTPDYIQQLRARGIQKLTLEQLVALRIHGIN